MVSVYHYIVSEIGNDNNSNSDIAPMLEMIIHRLLEYFEN